ncbi:hypothetical protein [Tsukamurella soli]|uniref:hypothetical protein n=1 Tax=Tsukamurella soli TaxID=644556 RepID=UPI003606CC9C
MIGSRHSGYIQAGFELLVREQRISVSAAGNDPRQYRVTAAGQLTAAPTTGGITA